MKRTWFALFFTLAMVSGATPPRTAAESPIDRTCPLTGYEPYGCYGPEPEFTQSCNEELLHPYCSEHDPVYDTEVYGVGVEPEPHYWDGYRDYLRGLYPYDYYDDTAELAELAVPDSSPITDSLSVEEDSYEGCPYNPYKDSYADPHTDHEASDDVASDAAQASSEAPYEYPYQDDATDHVDPSYPDTDEYGYDQYGYDEYGYDEYGYEGEDGYWEDGYWEDDYQPPVEEVAEAPAGQPEVEASEAAEDDGQYDDAHYDYAYDSYDYWYSDDSEATEADDSAVVSENQSEVPSSQDEHASDEHSADTDIDDYAYDGYGYESDYESDYGYGYEYEYGQDYQYQYEGEAEAWNSGIDDLYARQSDVEGDTQADDTWFDEDAWNTFESSYGEDTGENTGDVDEGDVKPESDAETWGEGDFYESAQAPVTSELEPDYESQFDGTGQIDPMDEESYWDEYEESWFEHNDGDYESDYQTRGTSSDEDNLADAGDDASELDSRDYWEEYSDYVEHPQHDVDGGYDWQEEDGDWQAWENIDESIASHDDHAEPQFLPADSPLPESYWPEEEYQPYDLEENEDSVQNEDSVAKAFTADYLLPYAKSVGTTSMHWLTRMTVPSQRFAEKVQGAMNDLEQSMQRLNGWMMSQYLPPLEELHEVEWEWEFED